MKGYSVRQKIKRAAAIVLTGTMFFTVFTMNQNNGSFFGIEKIYASSAEEKRNEAQQNLNDIQNQMSELETQQNEVQEQLSEKAAVLSDLLGEKQILEDDIKETQVAIDQTRVDLGEAKAKETEEYMAMKLRIQYMYENSTIGSIWTAIFEADGLADMLNRVEYVMQVHKTDRELLQGYQEVVAQVEQLAAELDSEMNDLTTLQEVLAHQEEELNIAMEELKAEAADFEEQLAAAQAKAAEYAAEIEKQNEIIRQEELRKEQERLQREAEARRQQAASSSGSLNDAGNDPAFSTGVSGTQLVNYALQFVGNPYKWGGNSLTNGCDCSGFVNLIYAHFGISVPRYSQAFKSVGQAVSYQNLKAGDIVVYPGHVAIYIGNGKIVEAQSTKAGITSNRSVNCSTITAIRRIL